MKFKESYIRQIIQEEYNRLNESPDEASINVERYEMARVFSNLDRAINIIRPTIPATETHALEALTDLDMLHNWFDTKLTGGEDPEGIDWLRNQEEKGKDDDEQ